MVRVRFSKSKSAGLLDFATGQVLNADGGFHIRRL